MPAANNVKHNKWSNVDVLIDTGNWSVIFGCYEGKNYRTLAMRWNGKGQDPGYPKLFGNPVWFNIPYELTYGMLLSISNQLVEEYRKNEIPKADLDEYTIRVKNALREVL